MTECDHCDNEDVVIDRVDDAVITDANSEAWTPLERFGTGWAWILTEKRDRPANAIAILKVNLLQRANCRRAQLDPVSHVQPRSAFTWAQGTLGPSSAIASSNAATSSASSSASSIRS